MAGHGAPDIAAVEGAAGLRVAVIGSLWHTELTEALVNGAYRALDASSVQDVTVLRVPGAYELSVAASRCANAGYDAIVALGVVIRGDTPHFDYVCQAVTIGLTQVSVDSGVPVGFGVLMCDDEQQARARAGVLGSSEDKGYEAAAAALATAVLLRGMPRHSVATHQFRQRDYL
jgi:6,7-dimethyl-8-ribityllumazine synthase